LTPAARLAAAIEVIDQALAIRAPADEVLKAWGRTHRFAGSKDRKAIAELVFAAFRARGRSSWRMGADDGRATILGLLRWSEDRTTEEIEVLFSGEGYAPPPLSDDERERLSATFDDEPEWVGSGLPEWLAERFRVQFGPDWLEEARAVILPRAPVDLRVNTLRGDMDGALRLLDHEDVKPDQAAFSTLGLRLPPAFARDVQQLRAFTSGWIEVQDEGSQIVAALSGAAPGEFVIDYCAGGGGKTLALAAMIGSPALRQAQGEASMIRPHAEPVEARGRDLSSRLIASDINTKRLAAMRERLERAGATADVRTLGPSGEGMDDLIGQADLVFVDAPCSGSGTFRRHPESAWRLTPETITRLSVLQSEILARAARLVRPGGRLVYVTCSMLDEENIEVAQRFAAAHPDFRPRPIADAVQTPLLTDLAWDRLTGLAPGGHTLQLTPRRTGTDGFFVALFQRAS
jgi:16S rRNA (cytosine967-C5)-methyltransferase